MMTEKQFIEVLKKIKERCKTNKMCPECIFKSARDVTSCQINRITNKLDMAPEDWDIKEIEELLNE